MKPPGQDAAGVPWTPVERGTHSVVTPEGVLIKFAIAGVLPRFLAFAADFALLLLIIFGMQWIVTTAVGSGDDGWIGTVGTILFFVVFNFYFMVFELSRQGTTPGKRLFRLRVIASPPGPLTSTAVLARNLTRIVEIWLPLIYAHGILTRWDETAGSTLLVSSIWVGLISLFPLFNRERLRPGDLIAGTIVVCAPKVLLLPDPAASAAAEVESGDAGFTRSELSHYGVYELHVLESVLREAAAADADTRKSIADAIAKKIGRSPVRTRAEVETFLKTFYAAQRAFLEREMLFGRKKRWKNEKKGD